MFFNSHINNTTAETLTRIGVNIVYPWVHVGRVNIGAARDRPAPEGTRARRLRIGSMVNRILNWFRVSVVVEKKKKLIIDKDPCAGGRNL